MRLKAVRRTSTRLGPGLHWFAPHEVTLVDAETGRPVDGVKTVGIWGDKERRNLIVVECDFDVEDGPPTGACRLPAAYKGV